MSKKLVSPDTILGKTVCLLEFLKMSREIFDVLCNYVLEMLHKKGLVPIAHYNAW